MKKIFAFVVFSALLMFSYLAVSSAAEKAVLYNYYSDNMLFKQRDEAVLGGKAQPGSTVSCTLYNSEKEGVAYAQAVTADDGVFTLSFTAPAGSFEEYSISVAENGIVFSELKGVVFGELWLAGGQSNMELPLQLSETGAQMMAENKRGSDALRFLDIPHPGNYNGLPNLVPPVPLTDYENPVIWYKGSDAKVYDMSAVGYYFAQELIEELEMPVGILNANLGGSSIYSWLSREAIEKDADLLACCKSDGRYYEADEWDESKVNHVIDMSANFNKTVAPLRNLRLSGMIWYQGEADLNWSYGKYTRAFNAMQDSYTELFSYEDGYLPIVFTQLVSYLYTDMDWLQRMNSEFSDIQQQRSDSRALTSILDVPLNYNPAVHAIHPICKKEVGEKMAFAAKGLVYGLHGNYTAATVEKTEIKDGSVYVTFRDVGDRLIADGDTLNGFSICGSDGIYFSAKAEIVSDKTVRVYSSSVVNPAGVAYAYSQTNNHANLFASEKGEKLLAVSPFITDRSLDTHYWHNDSWAACDFAQFWRCHTNEFSGYYDTWKAKGAEISFSKSEIDTGNALYIKSENKEFSVMPNYVYDENGKEKTFLDADTDWSDYATLTFKVKTDSQRPLRFEGLRIQIDETIWVMPAVKDVYSTASEIEADGKVHTVTLDLNRLYPYGNVYATAFSSEVLGKISDPEFIFSREDEGTVSLCFDDVSFSSVSLSRENLSEPTFKLDLIERIKAVFVSLYVRIHILFNKLFKK